MSVIKIQEQPKNESQIIEEPPFSQEIKDNLSKLEEEVKTINEDIKNTLSVME